MQARLEIKRFPSTLMLIVFALVAALLLGGALGYTLKAPSTTSGSGHVSVVPNAQAVNTGGNDSCIVVDKHKAC